MTRPDKSPLPHGWWILPALVVSVAAGLGIVAVMLDRWNARKLGGRGCDAGV